MTIVRLFASIPFGLLRLLIAAAILWILLADTAPRLARAQLAAIPDADHAAEVRTLREAGRLGESIVIGEAALADLPPGADRQAVETELKLAREESRSLARRAKNLAMGAVSGQAESIEGLIGAITADFFIVGDVRDLVLQGMKLALDRETDEVILALSAVGLATTLAPEIDWGASVLKIARKSGRLTGPMTSFIRKAAAARDFRSLRTVFGDVASLSRRASPGGAIRLLAHADSPADVARLARFVENNPTGAAALHYLGREGADLAKSGTEAAARAAVTAGKKGRRGITWLRTGRWQVLARPHALVGISKGLWKGNFEQLATRLVEALGRSAWWALPAAAAWVVLELTLLARRLLLGRSARASGPRTVAAPAA